MMRRLLLLVAIGCSRTDSAPDASCPGFFGKPNEKTGLTAEQCVPRCTSDAGTFAPPDYDNAFIDALSHWQLSTPYLDITTDPYASAPPPDDPPDTVCAVLPGAPATPRPYSLVTYPSESAARAAGASPTHFGHCGVCSPLTDLAVYMRQTDLTAPVRACGLQGFGDGGDVANIACLEQLGFDKPCAQAWYWDTVHTRQQCLGVCLSLLSAPYQEPDGALNDCIACDEVQSGPVFKAIAGRTRRNSGLPNALCRPCSEVRSLLHDY
jgi:hypothetical protein